MWSINSLVVAKVNSVSQRDIKYNNGKCCYIIFIFHVICMTCKATAF